MRLDTLDYVVLVVRDLSLALHFSTDILGLPLGHRAEEYAQIDAGSTRLGLYTREAMSRIVGVELEEPSAKAPAFELGFKVPDVDAAYAELIEQGVSPVTAPVDRPWGQRTGYVRDPDGNLIELAQDARR